MFLVGGPAFSGTTLLAHLLNQGETLCLDEPDFENPTQSERGIPFLVRLFPHTSFPPRPDHALSYPDALTLIEQCQQVLRPINLGIKTCNWAFIEYARVYHACGYPVIAIVRDIRDALVRPLPSWLDEEGLNERYRAVWRNLNLFDLWLRYEELVQEPERTMQNISRALGQPLVVQRQWDRKSVHSTMLKLDRHDLLKEGTLVTNRIGLWKTSSHEYLPQTLETAELMGYSA
jgi:hypothetical protein